jgi:hypothetical protein
MGSSTPTGTGASSGRHICNFHYPGILVPAPWLDSWRQRHESAATGLGKTSSNNLVPDTSVSLWEPRYTLLHRFTSPRMRQLRSTGIPSLHPQANIPICLELCTRGALLVLQSLCVLERGLRPPIYCGCSFPLSHRPKPSWPATWTARRDLR